MRACSAWSRFAALIFFGSLTAGAIAGCKSVYGDTDRRPQNVASAALSWQPRDVRSGSITVTLRNGKTFSGTYLQVTYDIAIDEIVPLWDCNGRDRGRSCWQAFERSRYITFFTGRVLANLMAVDDSHIECRFQLAYPGRGMDGGGQGTCLLSDGQVIDAAFWAT